MPVPSLEQAVLTSPTPSFVVDASRRIVVWNAACQELLGHPAESVIGRTCYDVVQGMDCVGRSFCSPSCPVQATVAAHLPVRPYRMVVRDHAARSRQLICSVFPFPCDQGANCLLYQLHEPPTDAPRPRPALDADARTAQLTPREREVLDLIASGLGTDELATKLGISAVTVRNHVQRLLRKMGARNRLEAVLAIGGPRAGAALHDDEVA